MYVLLFYLSFFRVDSSSVAKVRGSDDSDVMYAKFENSKCRRAFQTTWIQRRFRRKGASLSRTANG